MIKSKAMDRLRPPRPALTFGEKGLALTHTPPTYASHVALYLYDADGRKRFLDADKNELLAPGETGGALSVQGGHRQDVYLDDVGGAGEFSATVCYRSLNGFAFKRPRQDVHTGLLGIDTSLRCSITTCLLVNPLKARPCGHVYSKASAMAYFKGVGQRCAVFGCDKHLKWSDFVVDEASELALREYYRRQARTRQDADGHPYGQLM